MYTNDGKNQGYKVNARNCGIGKVLTELCMVDPEITRMGDDNYAFDILKDDNRKAYVKRYCSNFIALLMNDDGVAGGVLYLSAAFELGYTDMLIEVLDSDKEVVGYEGEKVEVAKRIFNPVNGQIGNIEAYSVNWFFCKLKAP